MRACGETGMERTAEMRKVVYLVAHPDDAVGGGGGTALLMRGKLELHILCATRGERGLRNVSMEETAQIREAEERRADELLGAASVTFLDRIDRELLPDEATCRSCADLLKKLNPAALFTIWPIDAHPDHSAISEIARKALFYSGLTPELYYMEESLGHQTARFTPDLYVDISGVTDEKIQAIRCHACQNSGDHMAKSTLEQNRFRGMECGVASAEGFKIPMPITNHFRSILFDL